MQFLEGVIAIVLNTLLLIPIITVSQSIGTVFEKIEVINKDLALESSLAEIPRQTLAEPEALLREVAKILSSNGVEWSKIEFLSKKNGRIVVENKQVSSNPGEHHARLVRIIRVTSEDIACITVSVEK